MFAVIYQSKVEPDKENDYHKYWRIIAEYFMQEKGALGSCLHKTEEGVWLAYSRWPDKATRDAAWPGDGEPDASLPKNIRDAIVGIKNCRCENKKISEICMSVVEDLL